VRSETYSHQKHEYMACRTVISGPYKAQAPADFALILRLSFRNGSQMKYKKKFRSCRIVAKKVVGL